MNAQRTLIASTTFLVAQGARHVIAQTTVGLPAARLAPPLQAIPANAKVRHHSVDVDGARIFYFGA
jgi:hypothetical protein